MRSNGLNAATTVVVGGARKVSAVVCMCVGVRWWESVVRDRPARECFSVVPKTKRQLV